MVRITTWNVNGIRNPFGYQPWRETRSFSAMFDILEADIVIMQELKIQRKDLRDDMVMIPGWDCYFSLPKHKKGYSGVGIYTRQSVCAPIRAEEGILGVLCPPGSTTPYRDLPDDACIGGYPTHTQITDWGDLDFDAASLDSEGRCLVLEFPAFVLFGVYSPANSNGLRPMYRSAFTSALDTRIRNLVRMGKNVILTGDLNVSRAPIDTAAADESIRQDGVEEFFNGPTRRVFNQLVANGKVLGERDEGREDPVLWDLCREFHPNREGMYTHWEQKINARPGNYGSRIDYVLCNIAIKDWFSSSNIQEGLMGSDHCPVYASTKSMVEQQDRQTHIVDLLNPVGMFADGKRLREFDTEKDLLPMSGKLLPEFDKRRSIKAMFARTTSNLEGNGRAQTISPLFQDVPPSQPDDPRVEDAAKILNTTQSAPAPSSPLRSSQKRRTVASPNAKPSKRTKSSASTSNSQSLANAKVQQSLKGFFTPGAIAKKKESTSEPAPPSTSSLEMLPQPDSTKSDLTQSFQNLSPSSSEQFIDPEASKEGWTKLFSNKPMPRCEGHGDECISYTTKKPGPNRGRMFYLCPRPVGPTGQKEKGTQWRCPTFIWASDWKSSG